MMNDDNDKKVAYVTKKTTTKFPKEIPSHTKVKKNELAKHFHSPLTFV